PGNPAKIKNYELPFTLKDPVKEGYKFLGWYTKADFSGDPVEKLEELTGKVKLYAKWEAIDYDITYELDSGENDPDNPDKYNIAELPLTLKAPVKEGYNFLGWFDNADFAGDPLEQLEGVSGDITLYAKWEETEYTITYETNGGAFVYPTKQEMIEAFLRDFYDFVSPEESLSDFMHGAGKTSGYDGTWHSSHKAKIYAGARPTEVNEDYFISSAKYMEKWLPFFDMMDEFVKINPAQSFWGGTWTGNIRIRQYIINELPGPAWTEEDMNMMPDPLIQYAPISVFTAFTEDFDLPVPHRDGFVFGGWFDNPAFDGEKISKVAEGTKENLTLYARWLTTAIDAEVDYNVALNASHGTYYIKVTVPGESLDKDSVDSIYVIMEAGTFVEPRALTPDTDAMMWFGVAKFDGLMYKEAGKYGYEVTRKDGTSYQFFFDYDPEEVVGLPERIEAEVDYNAVYNESHERWYIKVTPGELLDENSIKSIKTIKEAGEYLAEPKVLVPDTDTVMWFGVALADKDFSYRENGEYAFEVVRADDSVYFFFFTYDFREVDIYDISFAEAVDALILALPEELTLEDKEAVEEARAAYEELTERQKEYVENLGYLVAKETELAEMLDELENLQEYLATLPEQILVNYKLNTTDYDWAYKEGEDETVFDILTGELKEVRMTQTVRTFVVSSKLLPKVKVEHSINFGLTPEGAVAVIHGNNEAPADPEEYSISTYYALPFNNYTMSFEKDGTKYIYFVCQQLLFDETTTNFKPPKGASSIGLLYVNKSGADKTILLSDTYAINNAAYQDLVIDADGNVIEAIGAYTAEQTVTIPKDGYFWTPAYGDKPGIVGYSPNYDLRTGFAVGDVITFESGLLARMYPDLDGAVLEAGDVLPPLQWNSSNPDVIASDGTITPDLFEDKEVTLTAVVGTTGESEEVKVLVKAAGVDLIDAEVDYQAVYNADHGRWYIKVTVSGELLDAESISDIKAIMRAGEMLAEPVTLVPDTDTVLWFGVADETGDLGYKEAGEYAFLVTRKDDSQYVFKFDYDPEEVEGVIPNIQAVRDASEGTDVYTQGVVTSVIGNNAFIQDGSAGIYLYLGSNSSYADILVVGNLVRVNGKRAVFNSLVQISNISSIELVATEQELPEAVEFDGYVEISDLKDLQGSLVTLTGFKIKSIPTIGSGSYNIIITNDIVDVTIRVEQYVVEFSDIKDIMLSLFANQYVDWHNLPVGQYYADPQLMLSSVGQIDVKELTDNDIAQFIYDEIGAMYNDKVYPMNSIIELITAHSVYGGTISWESNNEVIDVETGQIGTVSEDTVVYLNATIKYGEAELLKTVAVTVKFIGEGLQLEYHFDFQSGGGTSYEEETYSFKNLVDNSDFEVNVHRISAQKTGAVEGATRALVISPSIGETFDGTAWAEFDFGETVVKQMEFDCYFWNSSAKQYFTKCELQVKDGDEWVTVLDILEELGDSLDINTFTVYDLEGSLFRFYAEGGSDGNTARILVDNLKVFA
ncbi:MAG: hypothetical protein GX204_05290, partial [Acholeplasmataceae bacterium]|nr:hypothetical protein [Acholeplasmataceae bacterium]